MAKNTHSHSVFISIAHEWGLSHGFLAEKFNVSRERIRQRVWVGGMIRRDAFRKHRPPVGINVSACAILDPERIEAEWEIIEGRLS